MTGIILSVDNWSIGFQCCTVLRVGKFKIKPNPSRLLADTNPIWKKDSKEIDNK